MLSRTKLSKTKTKNYCFFNTFTCAYLENNRCAYLWVEVKKEEESLPYCEPCDKHFKDERALYFHELEHEVCGRDGCQYSAHPKLVAKHVKMQHDTGLYKRIGKLNSKEDLAKWLEERKRKYPTRKAVEEKKALEEEKMKRGERITESKSKFNKSFIQKKEQSRKIVMSAKKFLQKNNLKKRRKIEEEEVSVLEALKEESSWRGSIPPFTGIKVVDGDGQDSPEEREKDFSDEEWEMPVDSEESKPVEKVSSSLGLLASFYDSDNEVEDDELKKGNEEKLGSGDESAPEEVKTVHIKEEESVCKVGEPVEKRQSRTRRGGVKRCRRKGLNKENILGRNGACLNKKKEVTLLEKLLSKEIRHERNVILQCVRYVVENKFFLDS